MDEIKKMSDQDLLARTAEVASRERHITLELMHHLREVDKRQLFVGLGHPSLYDFVIKELKFSEGATYRRIQTMRLIRDIPRAEARIADGRLSISTAAKVQSAGAKLTIEEKEKLLEALEGKSTREVDREVSKLNPKGPKESTRWLDGETVLLTFWLDRSTFLSLQELLSIRTHVDVAKTYKVIFTDLIKLGKENWKLQRTANSAPSSQCVNDKVWKSLTPKLREAVWTRDQGICTYRNPSNGARCTTTDLLQIDHVHPLALGGRNELGNLRLLCATHNRARADQTFGAC